MIITIREVLAFMHKTSSFECSEGINLMFRWYMMLSQECALHVKDFIIPMKERGRERQEGPLQGEENTD